MRRLGKTTLRWAQGPGRQSGFLFLNALAIAALPFIAFLRPECQSQFLACSTEWDRILFVPRLLFLPAVLALGLMWGSWRAQRRNAAISRRYFERLVPADQPEIPPGHFEATPLEQDLIKRTLRGCSQGALVATAGLVALAFTPIGLRACDPWALGGSRLAVCSTASQWTDMLVAFQLWALIVVGALAALLLYTRSTSIRVEGLPRGPRRFRFGSRA